MYENALIPMYFNTKKEALGCNYDQHFLWQEFLTANIVVVSKMF